MNRWSTDRGYTLTVYEASLEDGWEDSLNCPPAAKTNPHAHGVIPCADGEMVLCLVGPIGTSPAEMQTELGRCAAAAGDGLP